MLLKMTFMEWCETYKPIDNGCGILFFGLTDADKETLRRHPMDRVWSVCPSPKGWVVRNGLHPYATVGFIATEEPFELEEVIEIPYDISVEKPKEPTPIEGP